MKEDCLPSSHVPISDSKSIQKSELLGLLKTYNCYHEGKSFQLRHREEEGTLIIEGLLNIAWGLRRPIRLQMQDDREQVHLPSTSWMPGRPSCPPGCWSLRLGVSSLSLPAAISALQLSLFRKEPSPQDGNMTAQGPSIQPVHKAESSTDSS
ncbi:RASSF4 isoform 10, partial [Pongo abelii]